MRIALVAIGGKERVRILGHVLPGNSAMLHVSPEVAFEIRFDSGENGMRSGAGGFRAESIAPNFHPTS
jgi:hypothetical protein